MFTKAARADCGFRSRVPTMIRWWNMSTAQIVAAFQKMISELENAGFANDEALHQLAATLLMVQVLTSISIAVTLT